MVRKDMNKQVIFFVRTVLNIFCKLNKNKIPLVYEDKERPLEK